jgi:hypothetical protein
MDEGTIEGKNRVGKSPDCTWWMAAREFATTALLGSGPEPRTRRPTCPANGKYGRTGSLEWFVNLFGKQVLGRRHCGPNPMKSIWDHNLPTLQYSPSPLVFSKLAPGA